MNILGTERNFASLAMKDLLEARDLYHWHLTHKQNVVGTAVGLYFVREQDPWPSQERSYVSMRSSARPRPPRTFESSEIRDYSWPCVLVLVDRWVEPGDFGTGQGDLAPDEMVPKTLYLPDGRTVPVCVVLVDPAEPATSMLPGWVWPTSTAGGGFPVISSHQGRDHIASVGTLVTDGHTVYALTSRHVTGPPGTLISTVLRGRRTDVGVSAGRSLSRVAFEEVYPDFVAQRTYLNLDAGLVEVTSIDDWSSQTYGLPVAGELADLSEHNIGTQLINAEVEAFGAASGRLRGRVAALFFRYTSLGGYDQVTDLLIAPDRGTPGSQPGDSGTVWYLRLADGTGSPPALRPIALQWGGQNLAGEQVAASAYNFALAASLTSILRLLDVELVTEHNTHAQPFWGKTGHYTIAALACGHLRSGPLKTLMTANTDRISFGLQDLDPAHIDDATTNLRDHPGFVPLADVPDLVWKNLPTRIPGGRDTAFRSGPEHPTHYADIDQPRPADGRTMRQICVDDPDQVAVPVWQEYYAALGHTTSGDRGLLPFRVWQFFDAMVEAVQHDDAARFVCAAGLVAHYVGDACQPLHGSFMADGIEATPTTPAKGRGVHSAYESAMVDAHAEELLAGLTTALTRRGPRRPGIGSGHDAAVATVRLMDRSARTIPPLDLIEAFARTQVGVTTKGPSVNRTVLAALWADLGERTIKVIADGTRTLAQLWDGAFTAGGGDRLPTSALAAVPTDDLRALYEDPAFIPSLDLDHIGAHLVPAP